MDIIVQDLILSKKRGAFISVSVATEFLPKPGDKYSCGDGRWVIMSVERHEGYNQWLQIRSIGKHEYPTTGYILDKIIEAPFNPNLN